MSNTPLLDIIRYLFVLEVNSPYIRLPQWPAMEFSLLLGENISDRLPITEARAWKKSLAAWDGKKNDKMTKGKLLAYQPSPWPIDAVIFWYPAKKSYGRGELILFELKLFGKAAEHQFFLEFILPAMEYLARTPRIESGNSNSVWGHFDIRSIYSAKGRLWKPLLKNGKLDLRRRVNPAQWAHGIDFKTDPFNPMNQLHWLSPFKIKAFSKNNIVSQKDNQIFAPQLYSILESVAQRINSVILGKYSTAQDFLSSLEKDELEAWKHAMKHAMRCSIHRNNIKKAFDLPYGGMAKGSQTFSSKIPDILLPYLGLGAIIHIGEYTHFGCGTYVLY
ncbi:MAG: hypothetical protein HQK66_01095 [Desulfamplus sp.]|nr:hypothetical protein [Desulfamplus sp.]